MNTRTNLNLGWKFKIHKADKNTLPNNGLKALLNKWYDTNIPSTIYSDLLANKLIVDPYFADNENMVQWVADCDWVYEKYFELKDESVRNIVFEGIDTVSEIYLNGILIGETDNMFRKFSFDIKSLLKKKNKLRVIIKSPLKYAAALEAKKGKLPVALNSSRVYIRKAQYSFGWDWGPIIPNSGIWKDVYMEEKEPFEVEDISFTTVKLNDNSADVAVQFQLISSSNEKFNYCLELKNSNDVFIGKGECSIGKNIVNLTIPEPKLWWANGMGQQNLYELNLKILNENNETVSSKVLHVGIRTIVLELKDGEKETFRFRINKVPVFIKGANWIPADTMLDRVDGKLYEDLISKAKDSNMNMLRVWGGGIYEDDIFYELCDRYGLLVWQDFMFACGAYPEYEEFIENLVIEFEENIKRIRNHPSIALWCGNNENEWIWTQEQSTDYTSMPGFNIYHKVIPNLLEKLEVKEPYWASSPFGNDKDPNSESSGNRHQWYLWSFWKDYNTVKDDKGLFITEFGFQGPANKDTLEKVIPDQERNAHSRIFEHHNKQVEGPERVLKFIVSHLPVKTEWADYFYLAQLNQGLALKKCLEHWRTNEVTNGAIIWQLNDVWPVTSWSLMDSSSYQKLSYYFVKNSFSSIFSSVEINEKIAAVKIINDSPQKFRGELRLEIVNPLKATSHILKTRKIDFIGSESWKYLIKDSLPENSIIFSSLFSSEGILIHRNYFINGEWKHIKTGKAKYKLHKDEKNSLIIVTAKSSILFGDVYCKGFEFSERGFTLLKGESVKIKYKRSLQNKSRLNDVILLSLNDYLI